MEVLAAFIGKTDSNTVTAPFSACASTERQQGVAMHLGQVMIRLIADIHL